MRLALPSSLVLMALAWKAVAAQAPEPTHLAIATEDGGFVHGDLYGDGTRGVVLAHGGRFDKDSWALQARELAAAGFRVLAIDFRGYGDSTGPSQDDPLSAPLHLDILAAVRSLRAAGASTVAVVGASMGGAAAADAVVAGAPGEIDRLVLLASDAVREPEKLTLPKLFLVARDDASFGGTPRLVKIQDQFDRAPEPKDLVLLEGSAHAQFVFDTDQGSRALQEILDFLRQPDATR